MTMNVCLEAAEELCKIELKRRSIMKKRGYAELSGAGVASSFSTSVSNFCPFENSAYNCCSCPKTPPRGELGGAACRILRYFTRYYHQRIEKRDNISENLL